MYARHTTKDGKHMFISQMDDEHLKNTINLMFANIRNAKSLLSAKVSLSNFQGALYGMSKEKISKKTAKLIKGHTRKLAHYLAEAMLRGMNYTKELQELFERTGADTKFDILLDDDDFKKPKYALEYYDDEWERF